MALLNLTVYDEQNKMIGYRALPLVYLRPGYRYVNIKNESTKPLNMCLLFIHLRIQDYVPAEYER